MIYCIHRSTSSILPLFTLLLGVCVLVGCHSPRGGMMPRSSGSSTYYSTETMQKTISMIDLRSGEVFFQIDVPAGKQLTFDFSPGRGDDPVYTPDLMRWQIFEQGTSIGRLRNAMSVPNATSRRIDVMLDHTIQYKDAPPDEPLRVDDLENRPDWWTPRGGTMPTRGAVEMYD